MKAFYANLEVSSIGEIPVFVRKWGIGAKVLLVHGWMNSSLRWYRLVPFLARHYEVWAFDLPGFGQTAPVSRCHTTLQTYSAILAKLIDEISDGKVLHGLVGHSMGAILSLLLLKRPDFPVNCIIASGAPITGVSYLRPLVNRSRIVTMCLSMFQVWMQLDAKCKNSCSRHSGDGAKVGFENRRQVHVPTAGVLLKQVCNCNLFSDLQPFLSRVTPNILIARGEKDPFSSREDSVRLAQRLGGGFHDFLGSRHSPLIEAPGDSYPILREVLEQSN